MIARADLERHISAVLKRRPDAQNIAFSDDRPIEPCEVMEIEGRACRVVQASSELAMRVALQRAAAAAEGLLVLVTPLTDQQVGLDVRARLYKQSLQEINVVETIKALLQATSADDRLKRQRALCQGLLSESRRVSFSPVGAGVLTLGEAWRKLLVEGFEAPAELFELAAWLEWSILAPVKLRRLLHEEHIWRELLVYMAEELGPDRGPAFERLWQLWAKHQEHQAPGLGMMQLGLTGLALLAALEDDQAPSSTKDHAMITLGGLLKALGMSKEQRKSFELLCVACGRAYAHIAQRDEQAKALIIKALDAYLRDHDAAELLPYSRASALGWAHRLRAAAAALRARELALIDSALSGLKQHDQAAQRGPMIAQLYDVQRLIFKLKSPDWAMPQVEDVAALAADYVLWGSVEDMLREGLIGADFEEPSLQDAVREVLDEVAAARRADNARFAQALAAALGEQSTVPGALGVQEVLSRVVVPVVQSAGRALMIVLDGMSWSVLRSLLQDQRFKRWALWSPVRGQHGESLMPMLAALPSVTQLSRSSLLCGELKRGGQHEEREGFEHNLRLRKALGERKQRKLFHKAAVDEVGVGGVGPQVREAILDKETDLVGVVLNSVDDQLGGAQQLSMSWSVESIPALRTLLGLAEQSERAVILTSDHGHILDEGSQLLDAQTTSGRYRAPGGELAAGEVSVRAMSVQVYTGQDELVLLHDERRRYTGRQRGYHGGCSMPEVITPLLILTEEQRGLDESMFMPFSASPAGWYLLQQRDQDIAVPEHISARTAHPSSHPEAQEPAHSSPVQTEALQLDLLGAALKRTAAAPSLTLAEDSAPQQSAQEHEALAWIEALFEAPLYQQQLERFAALKLVADDTYKVLVTLARGQGVAHLGQLSQVLRRAETRVARYVTSLSRALNVEGYAILSLNRQEQLVTLNKTLLFKQFGLDQPRREGDHE